MKQKQSISIMIFILFFLIYFQAYAQQDTISQSVKNYWSKIDKISTNYVKGEGITKKFSNSEIDTLTKIYYKAINADPVGYNISNDMEREQEERIVKENNYNFNVISPRIKSMRTIRDVIIKKYGKNFFEILQVPYFLKVKIIKDSLSQLVTQNPKNFKTPQVNLTGIVEEVIKGGKFFKVGQEIKIEFLVFWRSGANTSFKVNNTYFMPLRPWGTNKIYKEITINLLPDNNYALYPIENGIISTPGNYFGISESSNWNLFKKLFTQKFILE